MSFFIPKESPSSHAPKSPDSSVYKVERNAETGSVKFAKKGMDAASSSVINFYPEWCHCCSCLIKKKYRRQDQVPCCKQCKNAFLCPPSGVLSRTLYFIFANATFFLLIYCLDEEIALDTIWALILLEILGLAFGVVFKLIGLPALLAPLVLGIVFNNIPKMNFYKGLRERFWITNLREIGLTIILTRAGVEMSPKQLKKLKGIVPLAAFGPCLVEAVTCAIVFYLFFRGEHVDIAMCFVAGFALAAVSPAVVVPQALSLQKKHYGTKHGIPTLLIAASSIDDVLAISAYSIALSFVKKGDTTSDQGWMVYAAPVGILVGMFHGLIVGMILHFIPSPDMGSRKIVPYLRLIILILFNICCMLIYSEEHLKWLSGAGSLGVLVTSIVASFGWRSVPHWKAPMEKIMNALAHLWTLYVPMLFGTIGNEILVSSFDWNVVGTIVAIIFICLTIRCCTMFLIAGCIKCNLKERLFCALSWIPKATVQAALAPLVASEFAVISPKAKGQIGINKRHSSYVVLLAVLGILITAPLGAVLISLTGKRLLRKDDTTEDQFEDFANGDEADEVKEIEIRPSQAKPEDERESVDQIDTNLDTQLLQKIEKARGNSKGLTRTLSDTVNSKGGSFESNEPSKPGQTKPKVHSKDFTGKGSGSSGSV